MPFRTRDFAMFLLLVAFLIVGITSTLHQDLVADTNLAFVVSTQEFEGEVIYQAVLPQPQADARPLRLVTLREKIANLVLSPVPEEKVEEVVVEVEEESGVLGTVLLCPGYASQTLSWQTQGLEFEVVEGARLVYREDKPESQVNELGETIVGVPTRTILAQLPLRNYPSTTKTCIPSDIIGIALDGSLMRNTEYSLYSIFGEETLLGYALDGFPIYGTTSQNTDSCGGTAIAGIYSYFLSPEREGIIGCFSGEPVAL